MDKGGNQTQMVLETVAVEDPVKETEILLSGSASYTSDGTLLQGVTADTSVQSLLTQFDNEVLEVLDVDGNGAVNTTDYARIRSLFQNTFVMDDAQTCAADVDRNGVIDSTDYLRIKAYFLEKFQLYG